MFHGFFKLADVTGHICIYTLMGNDKCKNYKSYIKRADLLRKNAYTMNLENFNTFKHFLSPPIYCQNMMTKAKNTKKNTKSLHETVLI